jgi:hypothetical protein
MTWAVAGCTSSWSRAATVINGRTGPGSRLNRPRSGRGTSARGHERVPPTERVTVTVPEDLLVCLTSSWRRIGAASETG